MERYVDGRWIVLHETGEIVHIRPGFRDECYRLERDDFDVVIPMDYRNQLIAFLQEEGMIKPIISNEARAEDLKIIHRTLDIIEKMGRQP